MSLQRETVSSQPPISLEGLMQAALQEDWETVDANIPAISNDERFVGWAIGKGIEDKNPNLRDLSVSIIEKSRKKLKPLQIDKLRGLMETDESPHVQCRSAFALFTHAERTPDVVRKLEDALHDKEIKEIARGYLDQLK